MCNKTEDVNTSSRNKMKKLQLLVVSAKMDHVTVNKQGTSNAHSISRQTDIPLSMIKKILCTILKFYQYKITPI